MPALATKTPRQRSNAPGPDTEGVTSMPEQAYKCCTQCGELKPLDAFYRFRARRDGRESECKKCKNERVKAWQRANRDKTREYANRYNERNREAVRANARKNNEKYREKTRARVSRYKRENREKARAHLAVHRAVVRGHLKRPSECSACGATGVAIQGHHDDYSRPLDVRWLCAACHGKVHRAS